MGALPAVLRSVRARGWRVFGAGPFDLNLVVERSPATTAGQLDDLLSVLWLDELGIWRALSVPCTADPGRVYLARPINPGGAAILEVGQYPSSHALGLHRGRPALVQVGPVQIRRDSDRDGVLDPAGGPERGLFGIDIHDDLGLGADASAGCVCLAKVHLQPVLDLMAEQRHRGLGDRVTLTVLQMS